LVLTAFRHSIDSATAAAIRDLIELHGDGTIAMISANAGSRITIDCTPWSYLREA
jgi:hypothetical protein